MTPDAQPTDREVAAAREIVALVFRNDLMSNAWLVERIAAILARTSAPFWRLATDDEATWCEVDTTQIRHVLLAESAGEAWTAFDVNARQLMQNIGWRGWYAYARDLPPLPAEEARDGR